MNRRGFLGRVGTLLVGAVCPVKLPVALAPVVQPLPGVITMSAGGLTRSEWLVIDRNVIKAANLRMRAWTDLQTTEHFVEGKRP